MVVVLRHRERLVADGMNKRKIEKSARRMSLFFFRYFCLFGSPKTSFFGDLAGRYTHTQHHERNRGDFCDVVVVDDDVVIDEKKKYF